MAKTPKESGFIEVLHSLKNLLGGEEQLLAHLRNVHRTEGIPADLRNKVLQVICKHTGIQVEDLKGARQRTEEVHSSIMFFAVIFNKRMAHSFSLRHIGAEFGIGDQAIRNKLIAFQELKKEHKKDSALLQIFFNIEEELRAMELVLN